MAGQLSNHFVERMRKIYELEPFIKLESSLHNVTSKGTISVNVAYDQVKTSFLLIFPPP